MPFSFASVTEFYSCNMQFYCNFISKCFQFDSTKNHSISQGPSFSSCTGQIRNVAYWTSRENSLGLIELSCMNKVSLVYVSSCSKTGSIRDDPYWTSRKNSLELIDLSCMNKVSLV